MFKRGKHSGPPACSWPPTPLVVALLLFLLSTAAADEVVYSDSLASNYQSWSWNSDPVFNFNGVPKIGNFAIRHQMAQWGGFSLWRSNGAFPGKGLQFYIAWDTSKPLGFWLDATGAGVQSDHVEVPKFIVDPANNKASPTKLVKCIVDFSQINPPRTDWNRISIGDIGGNSPVIVLDSISVLSNTPPAPVSFNVFGARGLLFTSVASAAGMKVYINGALQTLPKSSFDATNKKLLVQVGGVIPSGAKINVTLANGVRLYQLAPTWSSFVQVNVDAGSKGYPISPYIYGHAFASAKDMTALRIPSNRWGGNAETAYNPFKNVTNAGNDWFFENRNDDGAPNFLRQAKSKNVKSFFSAPALDWVSKDSTSCSFPKSKFPNQESFDPYNGVCGNGKNGGVELKADPTTAYESWTPARLQSWLATLPGLGLAPTFIAADNEMDIAASTHRDMHPEKATYAELLRRVQQTSDALRAIPGLSATKFAAPSSCCWYFYWNSDAGDGDRLAHGGTDFIVWFLQQMKAFSQLKGNRRLDYLDIHYYPNGVFNSDSSAATRAQRLRMTRTLWDPSFKDEGWIGRDGQWSTRQPNPNFIYLIPRFRSLIAQNYPGTMLAINEWNFGAESDISGGLAVVDVLGIFAREKLDMAHYWTSPSEGSAAWLGFWVVRGGVVPFGNVYAPVSFPLVKPDWNFAGVYAARGSGKLTLLIVNKHSSSYQVYKLGANVLPGKYSVKFFGERIGLRAQQLDMCVKAGDYLHVPAYTAVHMAYVGGC